MRPTQRRRERGSAVVAFIVLLIIADLVIVGMVLTGGADHDLTVSRVETVQAFYAAEAGVNMAIREMMQNADEDGDGTVGTISDDTNDGNDPTFGSAQVIVTATVNGDDTTLAGQGRAAIARRHATTLMTGGVTASAKMYWTDDGTDKIQRANRDGSNIEDLVTTGLGYPRDVAVDLTAGKMYWADSDTDKIQRCDLDGSNIEDLVTAGLSEVKGLKLDVAGGKMYWTDKVAKKIQRANLDGSNVEDLITSGFGDLRFIALDVGAGKMYWADSSAKKIQRADLDGSNVEDLVSSGLNQPTGIALDLVNDKVYWTDRGSDKIQRANLNGSNVEDLVTTGLNRPQGIAVDSAGGKVYWTDKGTDKIQRANLDGSSVEDLITSGLVSTRGITLDAAAFVGTVAHWRLDEDSGTTGVDTTADHDATYVNDIELGEDGRAGSAPEFEGDDEYVLIPHSDDYLLDDGSVSLWFQADDSSGRQELFSKDSKNYDTGGHLTIWYETSKVKLRLQSVSSDYFAQSGTLASDEWHHIVFTWGSEGMKLYANGILVDTDPYTGGLGTTSGGAGNYEPIVLGANTWTSDDLTHTPLKNYFDGLIDEVGVFDRALSETEIATLALPAQAGSLQVRSWTETEPN